MLAVKSVQIRSLMLAADFCYKPLMLDVCESPGYTSTAQKMRFSIKDFFSKYDQIRRKLRI